MTFQSTSRNIRLSGTALHAECRDWDRHWHTSSIDLDSYIGNEDGSFSLVEKGFGASAHNITLNRSVLAADLVARDGQRRRVSFDLNLCVANMNGSLRYEKPNESLLNCGSCLWLRGSTLRALCLGYDGLHHTSTMDLNDYYGNDNGDFNSGDNHFYYSARNVSLEPSRGSILLKAELKGNHWQSGDFWNATSTDLVTCIVVRGGRLIFEKHDGLFDREGPFTKFFERVPFVGFVVAGIHALAGNEEHSKRALALCANSSIVCTGIIIGAAIGGPLGGAIGAGVATPLGILVETAIKGTVTDPQLQSQFEEATFGRFIYETARNTLAAGAAGYFAEFLADQATVLSAVLLEEVSAMFGKTVQVLSEISAYAFLKKLADAIKNSILPDEWIEAEKKVKEL